MGRIAETVHTRAQEGAMFGPPTSFFRFQVKFQKGVILGPYKFDVGDLRSANKGSILGGSSADLNLFDLSRGNSTILREFPRLELA